jgi:rhodanese-related sulfurtransferase
MIKHPRSLAVVVLAFVLAGVLLAIGCVSSSTAPQIDEVNDWGIKNISPEEAYNLIKNNRDNPDFMVIDVRLPKWLPYGYIEGAVNIPLNTSNLAAFESKIASLDKNKTYLTYCPDGCGAAARIMNSLGFNRIYDISGGYQSWVEKGLPIIE